MYGHCGCSDTPDLFGPIDGTFYGPRYEAVSAGFDEAERAAQDFTKAVQQNGDPSAVSTTPKTVIYPLNAPQSQTAVFDANSGSECGGYQAADRPATPPDPGAVDVGMSGCNSESGRLPANPGVAAASDVVSASGGWWLIVGLAALMLADARKKGR